MRRADGVKGEGLIHALVDELRPHLPFRVQVVNRQPTGPRGKALVQPQLVPPVHGDEIAEPLVGQLVGDDISNPVAVPSLGKLLVEQNGRHPVRDKAPVLHGTVGELVDGQDIALGERVVDLKLLREVVDDLGRVFQRPPTLLLQSARRVHTDGHLLAVILAGGRSLDILKVSDGPGKQVGAHDGAALERDELLAAVDRLRLLLGHVGQGDLVLGDLKGQVESCLEVRLVEAGEGTAGITGLELGAQHVMKIVVTGHARGGRGGRLVLAAVEPGHVVVELAGKFDGQRGFGRRRQLLREGDGRPLGLGVVGEGG